jgi:phosphate transport system substrate-binding protein
LNVKLKSRFKFAVTAALTLSVMLSGVANGTAPTIDVNAGPSAGDTEGKIEGSGATFPWEQYKSWFASFTDENPLCNTSSSDTCTGYDFFHTSDADGLILGYSGGGSGAGVTNFSKVGVRMTSTQMFSGSDAVLTQSERNAIEAVTGDGVVGPIGTNYTVIPVTAGPVAMVYNLPGLKQRISSTSTRTTAATLRLNGELICGIYSGQIKKWNNAKIKSLNPLVTNLPSTDIKVVGRSDSSGTTFIFTSYLGKSATAAQQQCGMHGNFSSTVGSVTTYDANFTDSPASAADFVPTKVQPATYFASIRTANGTAAIVGKSGNGGIAPYVKNTVGTISYVESSYATKYSLSTAALETKSKFTSGTNRNKFNYLKPTSAGAVAALTAHAAVAGQDPINPSVSYVQPVFATGTSSYPIVGYSWLILYTNFVPATSSTVGKGQVQGLVAFLNWALTSGQVSPYLAPGFVSLPSSVKTTAIAQLRTIKWDGVAVWP